MTTSCIQPLLSEVLGSHALIYFLHLLTRHGSPWTQTVRMRPGEDQPSPRFSRVGSVKLSLEENDHIIQIGVFLRRGGGTQEFYQATDIKVETFQQVRIYGCLSFELIFLALKPSFSPAC